MLTEKQKKEFTKEFDRLIDAAIEFKFLLYKLRVETIVAIITTQLRLEEYISQTDPTKVLIKLNRQSLNSIAGLVIYSRLRVIIDQINCNPGPYNKLELAQLMIQRVVFNLNNLKVNLKKYTALLANATEHIRLKTIAEPMEQPEDWAFYMYALDCQYNVHHERYFSVAMSVEYSLYRNAFLQVPFWTDFSISPDFRKILQIINQLCKPLRLYAKLSLITDALYITDLLNDLKIHRPNCGDMLLSGDGIAFLTKHINYSFSIDQARTATLILHLFRLFKNSADREKYFGILTANIFSDPISAMISVVKNRIDREEISVLQGPTSRLLPLPSPLFSGPDPRLGAPSQRGLATQPQIGELVGTITEPCGPHKSI